MTEFGSPLKQIGKCSSQSPCHHAQSIPKSDEMWPVKEKRVDLIISVVVSGLYKPESRQEHKIRPAAHVIGKTSLVLSFKL